MRTFVALAIAVALASGCVVEETGHHHGSAVVIASGHVHSDSCGHYYSGGSWYHWDGHHHGPGCGHVFRGGIWVGD